MGRIRRLTVWIAVLILNLIISIIGTAIVETPLLRIFHADTIHAVLIREYLLSAIVAGLIGFFVGMWWRSQTAKWLWIVGILWFALRALPLVFADLPGGLLNQFSGASCSAGVASPGCMNWLIITVPAIRTVFYSVGSLLCSCFASVGLISAGRLPFENALLARFDSRWQSNSTKTNL